MKKIINGKLYNTETATFIGDYSRSLGNFEYVSESLYQKKNGEFFLHGEGGPMSKYSEYSGNNSWSGGEAIIPECDFDVKKWVESHCDADTFIRLFGPVAE